MGSDKKGTVVVVKACVKVVVWEHANGVKCGVMQLVRRNTEMILATLR